jgi:hypothetical protein
MKTRYFLMHLFVFGMAFIFFRVNTTFAQDSIASKQSFREKLAVPFGKIVPMNIEIVDGDKLDDKGYQSSFLIKVKSVENKSLGKPIIFEFKDETGNFPGDEFELYKYLYGKETGTISSKISSEIKKNYVGKEFNIMAYESGGFTGIPDDYFKYQPVRQDRMFHFSNYIIVVRDLTKRN